ncbi:MAG: Ig-like domain-containing protein [Alphaproteobacteria bacterium]|nr:Ig-like domain-containing protein [Alphaproteobacteria bacterium]
MLNRRTLLLVVPALTLVGCGDPVVVSDYFTVINISPPHGAADIAVDTDLRATFNSPIDDASVDGAVYLEDELEALVPAEVSVLDDGFTLSLKPLDLLKANTGYTLTLAEGLAGDVGALPTDIQSDFVTEGGSVGAGNQAPVASAAQVDEICYVNEPTLLDGGLSYDPEDEPLQFTWRVVSQPEGEEAILIDADTSIVEVTAQVPGEYVIGLVVNDGQLASSEVFVEMSCDWGPDAGG